MTTTSSNSIIAKNTVFLYARMLLVLVVGLYTSRVVLNVLGASDFGVYSVVAGFVSLFSFLNASFSTSIQRFYNYEGGKNGDDGYTRVFSVGIRVHIILSIIIFVILETFGLWYINNVMVMPHERLISANIIFQVSILSLLLVIIQIPFIGAIIAKERLDFFALVSIIEVILRLVFILLLPFIPFDKLITYAIVQTLTSVICFVLYVGYAKRKIPSLHLIKGIDKPLLKSILSFSGWTLIGSFAFIFKGQGVNMVLNSFFGTIVNAASGIAYQVNNAISSFSSNIGMSFRPQLVESYAQERYSRTYNLFLTQSKVCYSFILMLITPLILEMDYVLRLWLGDVFPEETIIFTSLVLIDTLVNSLVAPMTQVVFATGKIQKYQVVTALINIVLVPLCWIFLKLGYPAWIAFLLMVLTSLGCLIFCLFMMHSVFPFSYREYFMRIILPCLIMTAVIPLLLIQINNLLDTSFFKLIIESLSSIVLTSLLLYFLLFSGAEKNLAKQFLSKILRK